MDNITHSITAIAITSICLKNTKADKYIFRFLFVALFLVNAPDLDIIFYFHSQELYYQQHRGFTHSIIGGLTFIPLGIWIVKKVYKSVIDINTKTAFLTSFTLWFFGHFVLDYFTSYGIQIFYPFNTTHYDYAIMFIIDIIVWAVAFIYIILRWTKKFSNLKLSYLFLTFLICVYSVYFIQKQYILYDFTNRYNVKEARYSILINPFYQTNVYGFNNNDKLVQVIYNGFTPLPKNSHNVSHIYPYISDKYTVNNLPKNGTYNHMAKAKLKRYIEHGRIVACMPIDNGAECTSLKYNTPSVKNTLFNNKRAKRFNKTIYFNHK